MKKLVKISFILVIISSFILIIIPTPTLNETNHIILYDNQGNQIHSELYQNKGNYTPLSILPSHTYQAFISIEDKNFYKHHGFDIL
jgi:membrane carboxypeptidase/penicillin-binding protein